MDEFHIKFNIFWKYGDLNSWQKAELSSPVKKRKREESSEEEEEKRRRCSLLKNTMNNNKYIVKRHTVSSSFSCWQVAV